MNTQPEALAVAGDLEIQSDKVNGSVKYSTAKKAAVLLRTQHADIERKDALLRQCLSYFEGWANHGGWVWPVSALEQAKKNTAEAIESITKELAK